MMAQVGGRNRSPFNKYIHKIVLAVTGVIADRCINL